MTSLLEVIKYIWSLKRWQHTHTDRQTDR